MIQFLQGKKTFIIAACTFLYALTGYITGHLDINSAILVVLGSGGLASLRAGISKLQVTQQG